MNAHSIDEALAKFNLINGAGNPNQGTACVMTALSWVEGCAWTDHPPCSHPLLASIAIRANDATGTTPAQRADIVRAGETGLLDTWWVPTAVIIEAIAKSPRGASAVEHCLAVVGHVSAWKAGPKVRPDLRGAVLSDAVLSGADLSDADLRGADLSGAVLRGAVLSDADLSDAVLSGAVLSGAVLRGAVLSDAVLSDADLSDADLSDADLRGADLSDADLRGAVLSDADLRGAVLRGAVLSDADLSDADLSDADLSDADLSDAVLSDAWGNKYTQLPTGWKVADSGLIVKAAS